MQDIAGTRAKLSTREASGHVDTLRVEDINKEGVYKSARIT